MFGGTASRPHAGSGFSLRLSLTAAAFASLASVHVSGASPEPSLRERLTEIRVPLIENCGQWDNRVAFAAKTGFGTAYVTRDGQLVYSLQGETGGWTLTERLVSGKATPFAGRRAAAGVSYFHGNDPTLWHSNLPTYDEVHLGEVWPGISVSLRAHGGNIEKLFTIRSGARLGRIRVLVEGATSLRIDGEGALVAETGNGEVRFTAPAAYQEIHGARRPVAAAYVLRGDGYGFRLGIYDHALPVVIDPLLQSTYLGGSEPDVVHGIAVDPTNGEILVTGYTASTDFPGTAGGAQPDRAGVSDAFVARLNPALTALLQSTYLGGNGEDSASGIAVDPANGEILVAGSTSSTDFPGTAGGAQAATAGLFDAFVARLNPALTTLLQATYLGGSGGEGVSGIALNPSNGEVFVAGNTYSMDFPGTAGGAQSTPGGNDGFLAGLDASLTTLVQATYLGGSSIDEISAIVVHPGSGEVFVAGLTVSTDLPGTAGGPQPTLAGGFDGFVSRLNPTLTVLLQSTYLGGSGEDVASGIATDAANGDVLVTGTTVSPDFPGVVGGAQPIASGGNDVFVTRLNPTLTALLQSTYLGGSSEDTAYTGIEVLPASGDILVGGQTFSIDFPGTAGGAQPALDGVTNAFVARLSPTLTTLVQATYLGGSGGSWAYGLTVHPFTGQVLVIGQTFEADFPGTAGGAQSTRGSSNDAFIARLTPDLAGTPAALTVSIDIKPGSDTNPINPRSRGKIPVAILTTDTFDAATVDATTVRFGAAGTEAAPTQFAAEDVNADGRPDLLLHFDTQKTGIQCGDVSASLTGVTLGGQAIQGSDAIVTVGCR